MDILPVFSLRITDSIRQPQRLEKIRQFLSKHDLAPDNDIRFFAEASIGHRLAGCAGLAGNIVKCVVTDTPWRGANLTGLLLAELERIAVDKGIAPLFLCTRRENCDKFCRCGFWPVAEDSAGTVLMENNPVGLQRYCQQLQKLRQPGEKIAAIIMNADPFTLGHQFLAEQACGQCDWLHLFLVGEEAAYFSYADRLTMLTHGVAHLPRVTVHGGSPYIISRATFPAYFLKDKVAVDQTWSETDLILLRDHIAPALGITHRFVGSEPFCLTTRRYNQAMHHLLGGHMVVAEIARINSSAGIPFSASEVRRLLAEQQYDLLRDKVPATTFSHLKTLISPHPV